VGVCRQPEGYEWIYECMARMQGDRFDNEDGLFDARVYVTGRLPLECVSAICHSHSHSPHGGQPTSHADPVTGLDWPTCYGRPQWPRVFEDIMAELKHIKGLPSTLTVGVFHCGSSNRMAHDLGRQCRTSSLSSNGVVKFDFYRKIF
jgi:hypothetical protein